MADMNDFEDIEARLRRYRPAGLSRPRRAALLEEAVQVSEVVGRRSLWRYAAAVALALALNLAAESYIASHTQFGSSIPTRGRAVASRPRLMGTVNGFATGWGQLAVQWNGRPPTLTLWFEERQRVLREFTP